MYQSFDKLILSAHTLRRSMLKTPRARFLWHLFSAAQAKQAGVASEVSGAIRIYVRGQAKRAERIAGRVHKHPNN
jgi:hypothetical protein